MKIVTLSSKGQFTIPKALRTKLGITPGDLVVIAVADGAFHVRPLGPSIAEQTAGSLRRLVSKTKHES